MEVEAVTHALDWVASRGDNQTTYVILLILTDSISLLQKVKRGMGIPDWNVPMVDVTSTFKNCCGCTVLDMPE